MRETFGLLGRVGQVGLRRRGAIVVFITVGIFLFQMLSELAASGGLHQGIYEFAQVVSFGSRD